MIFQTPQNRKAKEIPIPGMVRKPPNITCYPKIYFFLTITTNATERRLFQAPKSIHMQNLEGRLTQHSLIARKPRARGRHIDQIDVHAV